MSGFIGRRGAGWIRRLVRFFFFLGKPCQSWRATNLSGLEIHLAGRPTSERQPSLESCALTRKEHFQHLRDSSQTSLQAPQGYIAQGNSNTLYPSGNAVIQKTYRRDWDSLLDRINVAFSLHDTSTPQRSAINSQSWKPRVCMLGFCWLWITLTTVGTMEAPESRILESLWQMSFVMPQLGWIAIPLMIRIKASSNFLANVEPIHGGEDSA